MCTTKSSGFSSLRFLSSCADLDAARAAALARLAEDVGLGDDDQSLVGNAEALAEMTDDARRGRARRLPASAVGDRRRRRVATVDVVVVEQPRQALDLRRRC